MATLILTILSTLAPVAVKLIGSWLDRKAAGEEVKKSFYNFVAQLAESNLVSQNLKRSYNEQLKRLTEGTNGKAS